MWGIVQQRVYQSRVHNIDELKQRLLHVWHGIDQTIGRSDKRTEQICPFCALRKAVARKNSDKFI